MGKKLGIGAVVVLVLALIGAILKGLFFGPPDKEMIQATLSDAVEASAEGRPSPVLDALSRNFTYDGMANSPVEVSRVIRAAKPKLVILDMNPKIDGDTAVVRSDVMVTFDMMGFPTTQKVKDVTISLKKEVAFENFLPAQKWKVTSVTAEALPTNIGDM